MAKATYNAPDPLPPPPVGTIDLTGISVESAAALVVILGPLKSGDYGGLRKGDLYDDFYRPLKDALKISGADTAKAESDAREEIKRKRYA